MKKQLIISVLSILGALFGSILFWSYYWGVNTLLFSLILLGILGYAQPEIFRFRYTRLISLGVLLSSIMVTWHNHYLSKSMYATSVFLLIGFAQQREIRFLFYGILLSLSGFFEAPIRYFQKIRAWRGFGFSVGQLFYWLKIVVFPLVITLVFMAVYTGANPKFAELTANFFDKLAQIIYSLFQWNLKRFWLFLFCLFIILAGVSSNSRIQAIYARSLQHRFPLLSDASQEKLESPALQSEYRMGMICLILLNLLLLVVNATDVRFVWMAYENFTAPELKQFVHAGTYTLIVAILMAMALLLYFFRRDLNFYPNNALLKQFAYAWIIQNAVLALSVGIRNFHYVHHYGLTYKRVGVFVFLMLVSYGLWTFFQKIKSCKTTYFLLFKNSWAVYLVLLAMTCFNWDNLITRYNLQAQTVHGIGVDYLVEDLSFSNLLILEENTALLSEYNTKTTEMINHKRAEFDYKMSRSDWRAWNWAHWQCRTK